MTPRRLDGRVELYILQVSHLGLLLSYRCSRFSMSLSSHLLIIGSIPLNFIRKRWVLDATKARLQLVKYMFKILLWALKHASPTIGKQINILVLFKCRCDPFLGLIQRIMHSLHHLDSVTCDRITLDFDFLFKLHLRICSCDWHSRVRSLGLGITHTSRCFDLCHILKLRLPGTRHSLKCADLTPHGYLGHRWVFKLQQLVGLGAHVSSLSLCHCSLVCARHLALISLDHTASIICFSYLLIWGILCAIY